MLVGLDFDNTIVNYDQVFYDVAMETGIVPKEIPVNKLAVRDFLRSIGREDCWTEMQGYVYGARMDNAQLYPGFIDFIQHVKNAGHSAVIISHKTAHPFLGPKYDLHTAAYQWIEKNICIEGRPVLSTESIFFEPTKEKKLERIAQLECDIFIDDLPEILTSPHFPVKVLGLLFDPDSKHSLDIPKFSSWAKIQRELRLS